MGHLSPQRPAGRGVRRSALPGKPPGFYEWSYLFAVGALTQSAFDDRIGNLTDAPPPSKVELLRSFKTAGWRHG
jgi:hypothetical protein